VRTGDRARRDRYVEHLVREIDLVGGFPLAFDTIYFGGGTPSSLRPEDLGRIVETARARFRLDRDTRVFLEVNPEDVTGETAAAWRDLGVHTLSLGVQSLDPEGLAFLGRRHTVDDARRAVGTALEAGFPTVSIDLIYGRPGQSPDAWCAELDLALALGAHHFSCYQLTIHAGTRFGLLARRGALTPLPPDEQAEIFLRTHRHLEARGMPAYEVSQFAVDPRHHSRHNLKYWDHTSYLGLGPAAHSYHERRRWWNLRRTDPWQERVAAGEHPVEEEETLDVSALVLEALMTALRTRAGVDLERIRSRWGVDVLAANAALVERLETRGLLEVRPGRLVPTLEGLAVADGIAPQFEV
jgi:oxygen-independent coproporphyrinogen-3 oxidase